jgi:hypothetical protein
MFESRRVFRAVLTCSAGFAIVGCSAGDPSQTARGPEPTAAATVEPGASRRIDATSADNGPPSRASDPFWSQIPEGYVPMPRGWVHPSCAHEVPPGATIGGDGTTVLMGEGSDKRVIAKYDSCRYPIVRPTGESRPYAKHPNGAFEPLARPDSPVAGTGTWFLMAYEECGNLYNDSPHLTNACGASDYISSIETTWTIPDAGGGSGLTTFLWSGAITTCEGEINCPAGANQWLAQTVSQFGPSVSGGGNWWALANMIVTPGNNVFYDAAFPATNSTACEGQTVTSTQYLDGGYLYCSKYTGCGHSSTLCKEVNYPNPAPVWNIALPGVLELSSPPTSCSQIPGGSSDEVQFTIDYIYNSEGQNVVSALADYNNVPLALPNCNWSVSVGTPSSPTSSLEF